MSLVYYQFIGSTFFVFTAQRYDEYLNGTNFGGLICRKSLVLNGESVAGSFDSMVVCRGKLFLLWLFFVHIENKTTTDSVSYTTDSVSYTKISVGYTTDGVS